MKIKLYLATIATCTAFFQLPPVAHAADSLTLFGTPLKGASRTVLRAALAKSGLNPTRVDNGYFCDEYGVNGQLQGATKLSVCYTEDDNRFASAIYVFPAFVDASKVKQVVQMVTSKYGRASTLHGMFDLGNVTATWNRPAGMRIQVTRGWPDTTVYLMLEDRASDAKMHAQMSHETAQRAQKQMRHDSKAF